MTNSLRITNKDIVKIEVNDNGEFIELNFADMSFPSKFYALLDYFEAGRKSWQDEANKIEKVKDTSERTKAQAIFIEGIHNGLVIKIDNCFGTDTCRKVFGSITPNLDMVHQFIEAITPFFKDFAERRIRENNKYGTQRVNRRTTSGIQRPSNKNGLSDGDTD